jgi:hypothetical protein
MTLDKPENAQLLISDLHRILTNAVLFAGTDDTLPYLASVHLESTGTHLVATGTDRFTLGASAAPYLDDKWSLLLPTEHVKTLLAVLKPHAGRRYSRWSSAKLSRSEQGYRLRVELPVAQVKFSFPTRQSFDDSIRFPLWKKLCKMEKITAESPSSVILSPVKLAKFTRVINADHPPRDMQIVIPQRHKQVHIRIGDQFVGLIMPIARQGRDKDTDIVEGAPAWLS